MVNYFLLCVFLLMLIAVALMLARFAGQKQEQAVLNLYRLSALEKRRSLVEDVLDALQKMGADKDILDILYQTLLSDLQRMLQIDPQREDLVKAIHSAETKSRKKSQAPPRDQAAVSSEQELGVVRQHMQDAMSLLSRLSRHGKIRPQTYAKSRQQLQSLAINIGVNSFLLMAEKALESRNTMKAFSLYRKAESMLRSARIPAEEKGRRLELIAAEKQRLMEQYEDEKGLLLMASVD